MMKGKVLKFGTVIGHSTACGWDCLRSIDDPGMEVVDRDEEE